LTAWFVKATNATPRRQKPRANEEIQRTLRPKGFFCVSDRLALGALSSSGIGVSQYSQDLFLDNRGSRLKFGYPKK
jgi:DNA-binding LacI/PurR family transcriptional regulator